MKGWRGAGQSVDRRSLGTAHPFLLSLICREGFAFLLREAERHNAGVRNFDSR
jgi:hypothetical protein